MQIITLWLQIDTKRWHEDASQDTDAHRDKRLEEYDGVVVSAISSTFRKEHSVLPTGRTRTTMERYTYFPPLAFQYIVLTKHTQQTALYMFGWGSSFHFARYYQGEAFFQALARHEHYLASKLQLKPGMRVLDVGCGVGGPAREIARFSGVNITGITLNAYQVGLANKITQKTELANSVHFVQGDFMKLSEMFGENSFDAVYAIEATVHAPTWEGIYGEIKKVLKPGCQVHLSILSFVMSRALNQNVTQGRHLRVVHDRQMGSLHRQT